MTSLWQLSLYANVMKNTTWNWRLLVVPVIVMIMLPLIWGCKASNTTKGGAIGAGVGGALGAVIGNKSDNTAVGAIIGATVGGAAGALIGRHMDKQAEELRRDLDGPLREFADCRIIAARRAFDREQRLVLLRRQPLRARRLAAEP